jgi:hypothetical protein
MSIRNRLIIPAKPCVVMTSRKESADMHYALEH